jgi:hypothetical protein
MPTKFFISYNKHDKEWAEWIAWTLEGAGYSAHLQAWDFRPGTNFVVEMHKATAAADRLIAVLSPDYLSSVYTQPEWASIFVRDPDGADRRLVPVVVRPCKPPGLLAAIASIRLAGLSTDEARTMLLDGVKEARMKPSGPPAFPG